MGNTCANKVFATENEDIHFVTTRRYQRTLSTPIEDDGWCLVSVTDEDDQSSSGEIVGFSFLDEFEDILDLGFIFLEREEVEEKGKEVEKAEKENEKDNKEEGKEVGNEEDTADKDEDEKERKDTSDFRAPTVDQTYTLNQEEYKAQKDVLQIREYEVKEKEEIEDNKEIEENESEQNLLLPLSSFVEGEEEEEEEKILSQNVKEEEIEFFVFQTNNNNDDVYNNNDDVYNNDDVVYLSWQLEEDENEVAILKKVKETENLFQKYEQWDSFPNVQNRHRKTEPFGRFQHNNSVYSNYGKGRFFHYC